VGAVCGKAARTVLCGGREVTRVPTAKLADVGFSFRARKTLWQGHIHTHGFLPAARPKALTSISRAIRRWALHHHSDKSLQDLAKTYNPYIEGWINYYGQFYRTHLRPTLKRIDVYVIRWARRKFKRLRHKTEGARADRRIRGAAVRIGCQIMKEGPVSLRVVAGRLDLSSNSIVCQLDDGETRVLCTIARQVLRDLGDYHQLKGSEEAVFSELPPEIERIASTKFQAGLLDENGELSIGTADLLRYLWPPHH
jgi:Group II intron, maturase-specific domain